MKLNSAATSGGTCDTTSSGQLNPPVVIRELVWDRKVEGGFPELKVLVRHFTLGSSLYEMVVLIGIVLERNNAFEIRFSLRCHSAILIPRKAVNEVLHVYHI
ncbi:hypothetical protein FRC03_000502 [Tulasnella sp. 419]|nr:hypothetical protein FRC03_000502 [Tulasnella sp. 419]